MDKFGQAISAIDTAPRHYNMPVPSTNPCLSDTFFPGSINDSTNEVDQDAGVPGVRANTVVKQMHLDFNPCVQLAPAINQPARINASFVLPDGKGGWRQSSEWEVGVSYM